jgi:hypothetical protein
MSGLNALQRHNLHQKNVGFMQAMFKEQAGRVLEAKQATRDFARQQLEQHTYLQRESLFPDDGINALTVSLMGPLPNGGCTQQRNGGR